jgi:ABC-type sugar transport system ATPase subunit
VTHDQTEAMGMADRIVLMQGGRIEQVGTPESIYREPTNSFVAGLVDERRGRNAGGREQPRPQLTCE